MKVALISEKYHPYVGSGAEKSLKVLADSLSAEAIEPLVISLQPGRGNRFERVDGVPVHYLGLKNFYWPFDGESRPDWKQYLFHLRDAVNVSMAREVGRILDRESPDLVHTNNLCGLSVQSWHQARRRRLPIVHTLRDYHLMCPFSARYRKGRVCRTTCLHCWPLTRINRAGSTAVEAVVGNSRFILDHHLSKGFFPGSRIREVIFNASNGSPVPKAGGRQHQGPVRFGFIGRIIPEKGVDVLLQAFTALDTKGWTLQVAGTGPAGYRHHLSQCYAHPNIEWLPWTESDAFYPGLDCLIVPSVWHEPLPRVIFEAFGHGLPVIASERGGNTEVIREGINGFLFDPDDPASLTRHLNQMLKPETDWTRLRAGSYESARAFRPERLASSYATLYRNLYQPVPGTLRCLEDGIGR